LAVSQAWRWRSFFGDEFCSLTAFLVDAVTAVLFAGLFAARHHHRALRRVLANARELPHVSCGLRQRGEQHAAVGLGAVGVSGRGGQDDGAVRQLLIGPTARTGVERLDQMMAPTLRRTLQLRLRPLVVAGFA
jgi:hypothetical protein